jgi:hypothetical protein
MTDLIPQSDLWWRYFIYGGLFHLAAATKICKTPQQANLFRFAGYAIAVIPAFIYEGLFNALWMLAFLYGWTIAIKLIKNMFNW